LEVIGYNKLSSNVELQNSYTAYKKCGSGGLSARGVNYDIRLAGVTERDIKHRRL